jgi:hypothetical protein
LKEIIILKSVFYTNTNEHNLHWNNLTSAGKKLFVESEIEEVIAEDFETDRFNILSFLEKHNLCDSFNIALKSSGLSFLSEKEGNSFNSEVDWWSQSPSFNLNIFYTLLNSLNVLNDFKKFMMEERMQYHQLCCDCGYPVIVPENIKFSLLSHITWDV